MGQRQNRDGHFSTTIPVLGFADASTVYADAPAATSG
jgi:hypothetical protein